MLKDVFKHGILQKFQPGEVIVSPYEPPKGVYLIKKGFVKSYSVSDAGDTNVQLIRSKNDIFPLLWTLADKKRDVFFSAMDNVEVFRISQDLFLSSIEKDQKYSRELQDRLTELYLLLADRVRTLEQKGAKNRLLDCLENLSDRFGKTHDNKIIINAPIHHHDIADMINTSRETTSREFAKLEKQGKLSYINGYIAINK